MLVVYKFPKAFHSLKLYCAKIEGQNCACVKSVCAGRFTHGLHRGFLLSDFAARKRKLTISNPVLSGDDFIFSTAN